MFIIIRCSEKCIFIVLHYGNKLLWELIFANFTNFVPAKCFKAKVSAKLNSHKMFQFLLLCKNQFPHKKSKMYFFVILLPYRSTLKKKLYYVLDGDDYSLPWAAWKKITSCKYCISSNK